MKQYTDSELMLWRPAKNVGSAVINPREIVRVCIGGDSLSRSIVAVTQPDSTVGKTYAVNGPVPIQANDFGRVCFGPVVLVAYDTGTPAVDDQYGWVSGQGTVSASSSNLIINNLRVVDPTNKLLLGSLLGGTTGAACPGRQLADLPGVNTLGNTGNVPPSSGALFQPYKVNSNGSESPDGDSVLAYPPPYLYNNLKVAAGSWGWYEMKNDKWIWVNGECPQAVTGSGG